MLRVIFLDRDGVVNEAIKLEGDQLGSPRNLSSFEFREDIFEFVCMAAEKRYRIVIFTNQPEVARGKFDLRDMQEIEQYCRMKLPLLDYLACYHDDSDRCECRKPKPGMLFQAMKKWEIDPNESFVIGDRDKDIIAGSTAGIRTVLLENLNFDSENVVADYYIKSLLEFRFGQ